MQLKLDFSYDRLLVDSNSISFEDLAALKFENEAWKNHIFSFLMDWYNKKDYIQIFTSGSTGKPKQIELLKKDMLASAKATNQYFGLTKDSKYFLCLSPSYIAGMMMIVRAIENKALLIAVEPNNTPLEDLEEKNISFGAMVPSQFYNSVEALKSIKVEQLILGGSPLNEAILEHLKEVDTKVYLTYGMTETITHIAVKPILPLYNIHYTTLSNVEIATDERDCLVIEAKHLSIEKVVTNDIVKIINANEFEWLGRYDNVINSGGIKIHPEVVEAKLSKIIKHPFFIYSEKHKQFGEQVALLIECEKDALMPCINLINKSVTVFSKYEIPKAIYSLAAFVRTDSGKVNRNLTVAKLK